MWAAVIVAAGSSRRAGFDKLAAPLGGQPVLRRSVQAFIAAGCGTIVVVCPPERWESTGLAEMAARLSSAPAAPDAPEAAEAPKALDMPCPPRAPRCSLLRVDGGSERQDSVAAGLAALPADLRWVAVHDGARPLIEPAGILRCLQAAEATGAAACAHPVVDTLKRADAEGRSLPERVSRERLWAMETPQIFRADLLRRAYEELRRRGESVTDEVSAMEFLGVPTSLVSVGPNLKITLPGDLELAELIWSHRAAAGAES